MSEQKPWVIIRCTSGQEGKAERYLERLGYPHGWHPTERKRISEKIYQRMLAASKKLPSWAQSRTPKRYKVKPIVTGYVFLPAPEIAVHQINGHHTSNLWMEVLCVNGTPYRLSDETMSAMRDIPKQLRDLLDQAQAEQRAAWEAKRPIVGQEACVMGGPFQGNCGMVESAGDGTVKLDIGALLGSITVPAEMVERAA